MMPRAKVERRWRRGTWTAAAILSVGAMTAPASGSDLAVERGRVLTLIGSVQDVDLALHPLATEPGLGFVQNVGDATATSLRLHFTVEDSPDNDASWGIQVKDADGKAVWHSWAAQVRGGGFWSDEIEGNQAKVEVYSVRPANPVRLSIDKIAVRKPKTTPLSITGVNQLAPIGAQASWIVDLGRSVARVRFEGDDGGSYVCTAFLVTPELMLTNQHCIATQSELESALIDFDYDLETAKPETLRLSELLQTDFGLDYALVRLEEAVERPPLPLDAILPPDDEQLLIIQHPGGEPKQVSILDCTVDEVETQGRTGPGTDLGHQCDTMGGSSGSPVFRFDTRTIVGLHHLGFSLSDSDLFNRAVHINRVLEDLSPENRGEVEAGQPGG